MLRLAPTILLVLLSLSVHALSHGGGLNKDGCHNNRKTGDYHCHRGQQSRKTQSKTRQLTPAVKLLSAASSMPLPAGTKAVDGDTIKFRDKRPDVRLVGCDAPESWKGQCSAERKLAKQSKAFLQRVINTGNAELELIPCSCPPGTEGTSKCNHGRSCGILRVSRLNVCDVMIEEGLAVPFVCDVTSCPPQGNWCE